MSKCVKVKVDKEQLNELSVEEHATITHMCMDALCKKAEEIKELYEKLSNTYGLEIGVTNMSVIVQVSFATHEGLAVPVLGLLGTQDGLRMALAGLVQKAVDNIENVSEEEKNG